jgi:hypothetical protein
VRERSGIHDSVGGKTFVLALWRSVVRFPGIALNPSTSSLWYSSIEDGSRFTSIPRTAPKPILAEVLCSVNQATKVEDAVEEIIASIRQ